MPTLDAQIDALYRLPLAEFTAARTALARTLNGADAARVKALEKPTLVPWAVNQLYWGDRRTYQRLMDLGGALRAAQVAALEGRKGDVREATAAHRASTAGAARRAVQLAAEAGVTARAEAIAQMLDALSLMHSPPGHPGRFTEVLQPQAFEALAGVTPREAPHEHHERPARRDRDRAARAAKRRDIEGAVKHAEHELTRARDAADAARRAHTLADAKVTSAEEALAEIRAQIDAFDKEQ